MNRTLSKIKKPTWVANQIIKIFKAHQGFNYRIYFNNKCWDISINYDTGKIIKKVTEDIKASDYSEYMNDDVISVDFSSDVILWEQMNYGRYEMDFGGDKYHNRNWQLVNALETFMKENGLVIGSKTETIFTVFNEKDL